MKKCILLSSFILLIFSVQELKAQTYLTAAGSINFTSDAPLEVIEAESKKMKGAVDASKNTFAFAVPIISFQGFNSALQREHFNENYMESAKFPDATFTGKIIEQVDFTKPGTYSVRAKGTLKIHGVEQERIIKSDLIVKDDKTIVIKSDFYVPLSDHNIQIPKIVNQKIATEIHVVIQGECKAK
ncbi:YceI family protein [Cytophagales bacterium LB-30]|uniref:YceI family protein n=1 Tax=Shiella aurantiaca TaxID=3058365 RepID=A0ABT8F7R6_9BACT|nr:YceI family protein [Shiella aurantiaca]MDN4166522.1 YceI family protein [Shiella aurantiaca]